MNQPLATSTFISSIGVNTHLSYMDTVYATAPVAADLGYLGISLVRDQLPADAASLARFASLAKAGINADLYVGVGGFGLPTGMAKVQAALDAFQAAYPGSIASIEGPNEPNIYPFSYAAKTGTAAAVAYQNDLYKTIAADPALKGVTVLNFAFGGVGPGVYAAAGNQNAMANAGNIHVYPDGEGNGTPQQAIQNELSLAAVSNPGQPMSMTEFGYSTYAGSDVTQATQAAFLLDGLFDAARAGLSTTYLYELLDQATGTTSYEGNFGLFTSSGAPKLAATALHNLTAILASGAGTLPGGTLNYTISGLTAVGGNSLLMEKANGAFDLAVWDEAITGIDVVKVSLGATYATVKLFDPLISDAPISILQNVSAVTLSLTGHPLIVEVEPGLAAAPATTVAAATVASAATPAVAAVSATPAIQTAAAQPKLTPVPTPAATLKIGSSTKNDTIAINNTTIRATSGNHSFVITGTGNALTATGGTETVTALSGGNALTTGAGNDTITFGSRSVIDAGGGTNTLNDQGGNSTIVLPDAGKGIDLIHGAVLTNGDVFDLRHMLQVTTWSGVTNADLGNWIRVRSADHGMGAIVSVAPNGSFAAGSHDVAHFYGVGSLSLSTLLAHSVTT